ncbi:SNF2-related protein [Desulfoplanes sp.]
MSTLPSWQDRLRYFFQSTAQSNGNTLYDQGRIVLSKVTPEEIKGSLKGKETRFMSILDKKSSDSFQVSCTCREFRSEGTACPHLWALLRAADEFLSRGTGDSIPKAPRPWERLLLGDGGEEKIAYTGDPGDYILLYRITFDSGGTLVDTWLRYVKKNGEMGQRIKEVPRSILKEPLLSRADKHILESMASIGQYPDLYGRYYHYFEQYKKISSCTLPSLLNGALLPLLAETGRCLVNHPARGEVYLRKGSPYTLSLRMESVREESGRKRTLDLEPVLVGSPPFGTCPFDDGYTVVPGTPVHLVRDGVVHMLDDELLDVTRLRGLQKKSSVHVPAKDVRNLVQAHFQSSLPVQIEFPERVLPEVCQESILPVPIVELTFVAGGAQGRVVFDYDGWDVPAEDPRPEILDPDQWRRINRQNGFEHKAIADFNRLVEDDGDGYLAAERIHPVVSDLAERGWTVRASDKKKITSGNLSTLKVTSGINWFDLDGDVDFGGIVVPLPKVIRAYLKGMKEFDLSDGSKGLLPEAWLDQFAPYLQAGVDKAGRGDDKELRFHSSQALVIDALLDSRAEVDVDERFQHVRDGLARFKGIAPLDPPDSFCGKLRQYQCESLGWLEFLNGFHFGGVLADDMGLGKTVQVLAWLDHLKGRGKAGTNLVVMPTSLLYNWQSESRRFTPELSVLVHAGTARTSDRSELVQFDLVLTTYGILRNDIELLQSVAFAYIILDESQMIKNSEALTAKAARALDGSHRLCLTGTPLENNVGELWSQMEFLNPGMLGSPTHFDKRFAKPISQGDDTSGKALANMIRPFILRRTKEEVATDLPDKTEETILCAMSDDQVKVYDQVKNHYRSEILAQVDNKGLGRSKIKILEGLLRLRQAACHPGLLQENDDLTGKLQTLMNMLNKIVPSGHKGIVFSQFTQFLSIIRKALEDANIPYEYLDGRTRPVTRKRRIASFQTDPAIPVFLVSLKAGGVGLNLTAADYVFLMDPWWNPAVEMQAVDRVHRIGQEKPVFTYRLISEGTVEEKVVALQEKKRELVHSIMQGSKAMLREITREDIEKLFS